MTLASLEKGQRLCAVRGPSGLGGMASAAITAAGTTTVGKMKGDLYQTAITLFTHRHSADMHERQVKFPPVLEQGLHHGWMPRAPCTRNLDPVEFKLS